MSKLADQLGGTIKSLERVNVLMNQLVGTTHHVAGVTKDTVAITNEVRDDIANFDDTFRPLRSYFYADPHCYNIPICWAIRSAYNATDGVDKLSEKLGELSKDVDSVDAVVPQLVALLPPQIETMRSLRTMVLTMHSTMSGMFDQADELTQDATAMGKDFDAAKTDDSFYLPHEVFSNPDFQRVEKLFLSPDGKAARFIISHKGDPATGEGMSRIDAIKTAAYESLKGTALEDAKVYVAGTAAAFKDLREASNYDFMIAGISSLCMIFIIMLLITRSLVAALVIVGTVALSLGASFGLSVLLWQYLIGVKLHWLVMVMSVIILLAVGSDYNLLLVARFKEETRCRAQDGHHPRDGWHRQGRDGCGPGVRLHHGLDDGQRQPGRRSGGHHHRAGPVVRHTGGAVVHDAVHRGDAGPLVLVADERPVAAAADQAAVRHGPRCSRATGRNRCHRASVDNRQWGEARTGATPLALRRASETEIDASELLTRSSSRHRRSR